MAKTYRVSCDFDSYEVAERFFHELAGWMSESVVLRERPPKEGRSTRLEGPRHWKFEDASPDLGVVADAPTRPARTGWRRWLLGR